jgi:hypothetical protein
MELGPSGRNASVIMSIGQSYTKPVEAVQLTTANVDDVIVWVKSRGTDVPWSGIDALGKVAISVLGTSVPGEGEELHVAADDFIEVHAAGRWSVSTATVFHRAAQRDSDPNR